MIVDRYFYFFLIFLSTSIGFGQINEVKNDKIDTVIIRGNVSVEKKYVEAAVIQVKSSDGSITSAITNSKGEYEIGKIMTDSIFFITASYFGYKPKGITVEVKGRKDIIINIDIDTPDIQNLDEVTITTKNQIQQNVNKIVYKIRPKDYIKNTVSTEVFNNVPTLSYDPQNGLLIEGRFGANIYIDGLESNLNYYKTLDINDIDKIEVISAPSARYGSEFTGGIVNVILKKREEDFFKGQVSGAIGLLRESYNSFPNISYKRNDLILKTSYGVIDDFQKIDYDINRNVGDSSYFQKSQKKPNIIQQWAAFKGKYNISKSDFIFFNLDYSKAENDGVQKGFFEQDNEDPVYFSNEQNGLFERLTTDVVYQKSFSENKTFLLKAQAYNYKRKNSYNFSNGISESQNEVQELSKMDEFSTEITYDVEDLKLLEKNLAIGMGSKLITRYYETMPESFNFRQTIINAFTDYNYHLSKSLSTYLSLFLEHTDNSSIGFNQNYFTFLPTLVLNKKFNNKSSLRYSFTKKIKRPSVYYLNDALIFLNPGNANKGNKDLSPEKRYSNRLTYGKPFKRDYLSITAFYDLVSDAIYNNTFLNDGILVNQYDNIGKVQSSGISFSYRTKLFKTINTNSSVGLSYNNFEAGHLNSSFKHNDGFSYIFNTSISTNLFNDKVSLALAARYNGPTYDLTSTTKIRPYTYLNISTNILKDRVKLNVLYSDFFNWNSQRKTLIDNGTFNQVNNTNNYISNITVGFSYNFGKKFNDYYRSKKIKNEDLKSR